MNNVNIAIYPGTFDPVTFGHIDILKQALNVFQKVIIGVYENKSKNPIFTLETRVSMFQNAISECNIDITRVDICGYTGLLSEFIKLKNSKFVVRGIRTIKDFEFEMNISGLFETLSMNVQTILIPAKNKFRFISSQMIKDLVNFGGDISNFVPQTCIEKIQSNKRL